MKDDEAELVGENIMLIVVLFQKVYNCMRSGTTCS